MKKLLLCGVLALGLVPAAAFAAGTHPLNQNRVYQQDYGSCTLITPCPVPTQAQVDDNAAAIAGIATTAGAAVPKSWVPNASLLGGNAGTGFTSVTPDSTLRLSSGTLGLPTANASGAGSYGNITVDSQGRITAIHVPAAGDITGLAPSAITDTTNAGNITSGTLPFARVPIGTGSNTVAAGNDSRIIGAVQAAGGNASATLVTATNGTVARSPAARAAETINAADYGVVCDGTTDNAAAYARILAQETPGATIYFPATKTAQTLFSGTGSIATSGGVITLTISGVSSGSLIAGDPIFGTGIPPYSYVTALGTGTGGTGTYVIYSPYETVLPSLTIASESITSSLVTPCLSTTALTINSGVSLSAQPGTVIMSPAPGSAGVVDLIAKGNNSVTGMTFDGGGFAFSNTSPLVQGFNVGNVTLANDVWQRSTGIGFNASGMSNTTIRNSVFWGIGASTKQGLVFSSGVETTNTGNSVTNTRFYGTGLDSVSVNNVTGFLLSQNYCNGTVYQNSTASPACYYFTANAGTIILTSNKAYHSAGNGFDLPANDTLVLQGNLAFANGSMGIADFASNNFTATGNTAVDNGQNSVYANAAGFDVRKGTGTASVNTITMSGNVAYDDQATPTQIYSFYNDSSLTATHHHIDQSNQFLSGTGYSSFGGGGQMSGFDYTNPADVNSFGTAVGAATVIGTGLYNAQSPSARIADRPDLLDFGTTFQTAWAKLATKTTSYRIQIPAGTFSAAAIDTAFSAGQSIQGAGIERTIIQLPASCTFPAGSGVFHSSTKPFVEIADLTIDGNGCTPVSGFPSAISISGASVGVYIHNVQFINFGAATATGGWNVLSINHSSNVWVDHIACTMAPSIDDGHCIDIDNSAGATDNVVVSDNTLTGGGLIAGATRLKVIGNDISGWGYGSGVTLIQNSVSAMTLNGPIVALNNIHDSGSAADENSTFPNGIEDWMAGSIVYGNHIWNTAGNAITLGGQNSLIEGNTSYESPQDLTGTNAAAIDMRYTSSTVNGNGSVIEGNVVIPDATGNVKYGYADVAGTSGVSLIGNSFWGTIGPYVLAGTTSSTFGSIFYSGSGFWQNVDIAAPGGSASKQILTGTGTLVVSPTSSGYTWNVTMPAGASQGQPVTIVFDKAMTTTFAGSGSDTVVNPITSVVAGQRVTLTYSGTAWH